MPTPRLAVVDYGAGNLRSLTRALVLAGAVPFLARTPQEAAGCDVVIVPGVGAFGAAMQRLEAAGFPAWLRAGAGGRPLIGVCLGMQLLFESSEESPGVLGLGLLPGDVRRLPGGLKVPHMGWNQVVWRDPLQDEGAGFFYFVHSYIVRPVDPTVIVAAARYGNEFPAVVQRDRVLGVQFHPEKSGAAGQRLLRRLLAWSAAAAAPSGI